MEKILQILSVFLLLFLVIKIFGRRDEKEFKEYYLFRRIILNRELWLNQLIADSINRQLFILCQTKVLVIDIDSDEVIKEFLYQSRAVFMTLAGELNRGFVVDADNLTLVVIDLRSLEIIGIMPESGFEEGVILFDPFTSQLFVFNSLSNNLMVIDPLNLTVKRSILLPGKPTSAVTDEAGSLYVCIDAENLIVEIDAGRGHLLRQWQIESVLTKASISIDNKNQLLFIGCGNRKLGIFNYRAGKMFKIVGLEDDPDKLVFDPLTKLIFISNGSQRISLIGQVKGEEYKLVQVIQTPGGSNQVALDMQTKKIYLDTVMDDPKSRSLLTKNLVVLVFSNE